MILVPRQLRRSGMTGSVPYYGGRFTPAQAYAASHPSQQVPPGVAQASFTRPAPGAPDQAARTAWVEPPDREQMMAHLQELLDGGVVTAQEYEDLRDRMAG